MIHALSFKTYQGASSIVPKVKLNTGAEMPIIGLGTFAGTRKTCVTPKGVVGQVVEDSIEKHGYRQIDCAQNYLNEDEIGDAIANVNLLTCSSAHGCRY